MERNARIERTILTRLGKTRVERICFHCGKCVGHCPFDRALNLEDKSVTSGAEAIYAETASSDGYEEASRKLKKLADVTVSKATLPRRSISFGGKMQVVGRLRKPLAFWVKA